jgi:hypothetical protein
MVTGRYLRDARLTTVTGRARRGDRRITVGGRPCVQDCLLRRGGQLCSRGPRTGIRPRGPRSVGWRAASAGSQRARRLQGAAAVAPPRLQVASASRISKGQYVVLILSDKRGVLTRYL